MEVPVEITLEELQGTALTYTLHSVFRPLTSRGSNLRVVNAVKAASGSSSRSARVTWPCWTHDGGRVIEGVRTLIKS